VITGQEEPLHRKYTHKKPLPLTTNTHIKSPSATLSREIGSEPANPSLLTICDRNCLSTDFLVHSLAPQAGPANGKEEKKGKRKETAKMA
jgi:hypothetical protein